MWLPGDLGGPAADPSTLPPLRSPPPPYNPQNQKREKNMQALLSLGCAEPSPRRGELTLCVWCTAVSGSCRRFGGNKTLLEKEKRKSLRKTEKVVVC